MCGSLRREGQNALVGHPGQAGVSCNAAWGSRTDSFPVTDKDGTSQAMFNGHARQETLKDAWLSKGWQRAEVHVSGYTESGRVYDVPRGYVISAVSRTIPNRGKIFNIVTREARGAEKEVHSRFPVIKRPQLERK